MSCGDLRDARELAARIVSPSSSGVCPRACANSTKTSCRSSVPALNVSNSARVLVATSWLMFSESSSSLGLRALAGRFATSVQR